VWAQRVGIVVDAPTIPAEPKVEAPKAEPLRVEAPKVEPPRVEPPRVEPPRVEAPKVEAPKVEPARVEAPRVEAPRVEAPRLPILADQLAACTSLDDVRNVLGDCTRCKLHSGRHTIVYGVGNPKAELMFVGEGPGAEEDRRGEPFVGAAGELLTSIIEKGMGLKRSDVYIANVVKCRPPQNRDPEPDEVAACQPFLAAQIDAIKPKVLITLGKHASHNLLGIQTPITRLRGKWSEYRGTPLMPTYHPAYLLRNPAEKRAVWEDVKEVLRFMGKTPPSKP
jgi:uracil-DNA glycosylase